MRTIFALTPPDLTIWFKLVVSSELKLSMFSILLATTKWREKEFLESTAFCIPTVTATVFNTAHAGIQSLQHAIHDTSISTPKSQRTEISTKTTQSFSNLRCSFSQKKGRNMVQLKFMWSN